jgi:hypothetical protein
MIWILGIQVFFTLSFIWSSRWPNCSAFFTFSNVSIYNIYVTIFNFLVLLFIPLFLLDLHSTVFGEKSLNLPIRKHKFFFFSKI